MSIHVCITLTYDIQMLIYYQNGRLKISEKFYCLFWRHLFPFLSFCKNYWVNDHLPWLFYPAILPEAAYEVVPIAISISFNKRITRNMLKQKGHYLQPNSSVNESAVLITQGLRVQVPLWLMSFYYQQGKSVHLLEEFKIYKTIITKSCAETSRNFTSFNFVKLYICCRWYFKQLKWDARENMTIDNLSQHLFI